jgi:hypothetical protein
VVKKLYNKRGALEVLKRFCYLSRYNYESKPTFKHKTEELIRKVEMLRGRAE